MGFGKIPDKFIFSFSIALSIFSFDSDRAWFKNHLYVDYINYLLRRETKYVDCENIPLAKL